MTTFTQTQTNATHDEQFIKSHSTFVAENYQFNYETNECDCECGCGCEWWDESTAVEC